MNRRGKRKRTGGVRPVLPGPGRLASAAVGPGSGFVCSGFGRLSVPVRFVLSYMAGRFPVRFWPLASPCIRSGLHSFPVPCSGRQ